MIPERAFCVSSSMRGPNSPRLTTPSQSLSTLRMMSLHCSLRSSTQILLQRLLQVHVADDAVLILIILGKHPAGTAGCWCRAEEPLSQGLRLSPCRKEASAQVGQHPPPEQPIQQQALLDIPVQVARQLLQLSPAGRGSTGLQPVGELKEHVYVELVDLAVLVGIQLPHPPEQSENRSLQRTPASAAAALAAGFFIRTERTNFERTCDVTVRSSSSAVRTCSFWLTWRTGEYFVL